MFDGIINNLPVEIHLPSYPGKGEYVPDGSYNNTSSYSYAGPGTHFIKRIREGYVGINDLDKAAKEHDAAYHFYKDRASRNISDRILAKKALEIASDTTKSGYEKAMAAFVYKTFTEGGIADKLQGIYLFIYLFIFALPSIKDEAADGRNNGLVREKTTKLTVL